MKRRGFGCFTITGIIAAISTFVIIACGWLITGGEMFSPGRLNAQLGSQQLGGVKSHAQTGGNCGACHVPPLGQATMDARCQACHTDIPPQLQDPHSLHGILTMQNSSFSCRACHVDHRGAEASLTSLTIKQFPHQLLGFALHAHQTNSGGRNFGCVECHPNTLASFDITTCETCHQALDGAFMASHLAAFGVACLDCHDGVDSYGKKFSHQAVPFVLTGKHTSLGCGDCHGGARSIAELKAAPQDCYSCHAGKDAHSGQLGTDCGACHTTAAWSPAAFDHSKSTFPLTGAHTTVPCQSCHVDAVFASTPTSCDACHAKDDAHTGEFGTDCSLCHTTTAWLPSTFDHTKTSFPLTGAHTLLKCSQCHVNNTFVGTPTDCVACHPEPAYHKGLFDIQCDACHSTSAWSPARFTVAHQFPLSHGGAGTCFDCHPNTLSDWTCYAGCHAHDQAEIVAKHQEENINNLSDCIGCHPNGTGGGD